MKISLIAAASENNVIGNRGKLTWRLPADLKHFRELTKGHPVIMGRKTYESIGGPLPHRFNIVVTRQDIHAPGCTIVHSLDEAFQASEASEAFVIGGGEIYEQSLPLASRIYLTRVHATVEGDVFFPEIDSREWSEVSRERHEADAENPHPHTFLIYERRGGNTPSGEPQR